ncbi:MAG: Eco57I restriction-modification methylase domain-containing protein [Bacteroidales bacterium]|nr:Eco57I restriction-modification methylase domain-containing protein [Bacteroidales bacterium]
MALFQASVIKNSLSKQDKVVIAKAYKKFKDYFFNPTIQENIRKSKEEQFQEGFLRELFVNVLGYTINPNPDYNLTTEFKNQTGAKKADGAILVDGKAVAVVELKSTKTKDLESIRQQAFDYKSNQANCIYVVTSNFERLRFYIENSVEFEDFDLFTLNEERFELLYFCLASKNLLNNLPLQTKEESVVKEAKITKQLYADYSLFKREIFRDIVKKNMDNPSLLKLTDKDIKKTLFKKTQKLMDRFLFIFFAEDKQLIPANSITKINDKWQDDVDFGEDKKLYELYKQYFHVLDIGRPKSGKRQEIFAYNGGLFEKDSILDALIIDDALLKKHTAILTAYDFDTDVDVNILGHIFENSLNEIESINAEIEGLEFDKQKTKRKKDGVFYTPKYITKYIVDNTVGKLCKEKRQELDINDEVYLFAKQRSRKRIENLEEYRKWLLQLTICDPACGSGAFLNQALDFLIKEHAYIDELTAKYNNEPMLLSDIENSILEHNIYGVDINEESVDIAKLSLWLRTAQKGRKLTSLNTNIKCGNSLIDDPSVAGDKAFNWQKEFPEIFAKKKKKAWHITTATHNSRYSQRMFDNHVKLGDAVWIDEKDEIIITETIAEIVKKDKLNVIEYNVCGDHMHLLLVCEEDDRDGIVGKIKSMTSRAVNIASGKTVVANHATMGHAPLSASMATTAREHAPLSASMATTARGETQTKLWTQKFGNSEIKDEDYLNNAIEYIRNNRIKHELPVNKEIEKLKKEFLSSVDDAFRTEYNGGFDVVIGNPPYVRQELFKEFKPFLEEKYYTYQGTADLYTYFFELSVDRLLSKRGVFSIIVANKWMRSNYGKPLRKWMNSREIVEIIDFGDLPVFSDASAYPCIISLTANKPKEFLKATKPTNLNFSDLDLLVKSSSFSVATKSLNENSWALVGNKVSELIELLKGKGVSLKNYVNSKIFYGIKTGMNEAFIIESEFKEQIIKENPNSSTLIRPFVAGKDIKRYHVDFQNKFLIVIPSGWTNTNRKEDDPFCFLKEHHPIITEHLSKYKDKLAIRSDQGDYWWELRACAYYNQFNDQKLLLPDISTRGNFALDIDNKLYTVNTAYIIGNADIFLLGTLNSKLITFYYKNISPMVRGGYLRFIYQYLVDIPIVEFIDSKKQQFTHIVEEMNIATKLKEEKLNQFSNFLKSQFQLENLPKKLQNWHELEFADFIKELNKAIKKAGGDKLSKMDEMEWMEVFETKKTEAQAIKTEIDKTDKEIDQMVYALYGLTEEEIKIVEGN